MGKLTKAGWIWSIFIVLGMLSVIIAMLLTQGCGGLDVKRGLEFQGATGMVYVNPPELTRIRATGTGDMETSLGRFEFHAHSDIQIIAQEVQALIQVTAEFAGFFGVAIKFVIRTADDTMELCGLWGQPDNLSELCVPLRRVEHQPPEVEGSTES